MSDLEETEQPTLVPVLATDDLYDDPGEDWDGTATRTALSSGVEAAGLVPGTDLDAQVLNDLIGRIGQGLATILDSAAVNWTLPAEATGVSFAGFGNGLFAGPIVIPVANYSGYRRDVLGVYNDGGLYYSVDGRAWTNPGGIGFSGTGANGGLTAGGAEITGEGWNTWIVAYATESTTWKFRASGNVGASWFALGQLPSGIEGAAAHVMGYFDAAPDDGLSNSKFYFWCARSQLFYRSMEDLFSADTTDWTQITTSGFWTGAPPPSPTCFASAPAECAIGIAGSPYVISSSDGTTWAASGTGLSGSVSHLHWASAHNLWLAFTTDGKLWSAPAGMASWTERIALGTTPFALGSLGRVVVMTRAGMTLVSRDLTNVMRIPPDPSDDEWEFLLSFNGGLWMAKYDAAEDTTFELAMSQILPSALRKVKAW